MDEPPLKEGYWRRTFDEASDLPWPESGAEWLDRDAFLENLAWVESQAHAVALAGFSTCRVCGRPNGTSEFWLDDWAWPEGFRHYVELHGIRPSARFEAMISKRAEC